MGMKFNPLSGKFDLDSGGSSAVKISEYDNADKPTSANGDVWVKRTMSVDGVAGEPRGLLLALTYAGEGASTYELSWQSIDSGIKRITFT